MPAVSHYCIVTPIQCRPDLHCPVTAGRSNMLSIRRPGYCVNTVRMARETPLVSSCPGIPDMYRLIIAGRGNVRTVGRRPDHCTYAIGVTTIEIEQRARLLGSRSWLWRC